jgi:apolipoprotein N-acyltransferase
MAAIDDFVGSERGGRSESVWSRYAAATRELAQSGARVVVLPEMIATLAPDTVERTRAMLSATARENQVSVLAGVGVKGASLHNRAWLFLPQGEPVAEPVAEYDKRHLVPGLEAAITPGHTPLAVPINGRLYGIAICKDMHFPSLGRDNGSLHVAAMLVPAWDFDEDAWYAARLTALRGVENGFTIVRSSKHGLLSVSDRYGRFLAETRSRRLPGATLLASAPVEDSAGTLYTSIGDLFGWLCLAAAAAAYVASLRKRRA